jgi:hypothetical protein
LQRRQCDTFKRLGIHATGGQLAADANSTTRASHLRTNHARDVAANDKHSPSFVINLADIQLTAAQQSVLDLGLTFIPTYRYQPTDQIYKFQDRLIRNLKLKDYFGDRESDDEGDNYDPNRKTFTEPSTWTPPDSRLSPETLKTVHDIATATENLINRHRMVPDRGLQFHHYTDNLTAEQRSAIDELRSNSAIIIKPADKGSATVLMHRWAYAAEAHRQLNNIKYYRKLTRPLDNLTLINDVLTDMKDEGYITEAQRRFLEAKDTDRGRIFYLLPKIHKPPINWPIPNIMPEGRPIVSDTGSESYRVAQYIDQFLRPISIRHKSYIKDTYDFVDKIRGRHIPDNAIIVTGDVTALYTNMEIGRIMQVVSDALAKYPARERPDEHIKRLLDITLRNNDFSFDDEHYLQICGTAMGKTYAPALADLYMESFDEGATADTNVHLFSRFLDDIFYIWTGDEQGLQQHGVMLNSLIPGITVTLNWSRTSVNFLDTTIYINESSLQTRVHFKPTDTHQLLHIASFHPRHTCKGVLKSQLIRFRRISSTKQDYDAACAVLFPVLRKRRYSRRMMRHMKAEIWTLRQNDRLLLNKQQHNQPVIPVVIPYNEIGTSLAASWRRIIQKNNVFDDFKLVSAYTVARNLKHRLVRSSFTTSTTGEREIRPPAAIIRTGCFRCQSNRCHACDYVTACSSFRGTVNGRVFPVHGHIDCKTRNVVYLVTCRKCNLQYVGETGRTLADRINDHLSCIRTSKRTPISLHFNAADHSITDFSIAGIEMIDAGDNTPTMLLVKERTWQNILQTIYPQGINGSTRK